MIGRRVHLARLASLIVAAGLAAPLVAQELTGPPKDPKATRKPDLVEIVALDPTIRLDIRYAGTNNFLGQAVYPQARAFLQRPAAEAVVAAHRDLRAHGYGLLIHDGYRPWSITKRFWDLTSGPQRAFVANPATGSKHNRGCAIDLTLFDLASGNAVVMPSAYDEMTERSHPDYPGGTSGERARRDLLRRTMERHGFTVEPNEWWHFNYRDWALYPILDVAFDAIGARTEDGRKRLGSER